MNLTDIVKITESAIYIEVLTIQESVFFLDEVLEKIKKLDIDNIKVVFDMILRNGLNNRLFYSYIQNHEFTEFHKMKSEEIEKDFDYYFKNNVKYIEHSLLSSRDKEFYYQRIRFMER